LYVDLVAAADADWPIATPPVKLRRELSLAEWADSSECGLLVEPRKKKKQTVMKRPAVQLAACVCVDEMMWEGNFQQRHYYSMLLLWWQLERESANV